MPADDVILNKSTNAQREFKVLRKKDLFNILNYNKKKTNRVTTRFFIKIKRVHIYKLPTIKKN